VRVALLHGFAGDPRAWDGVIAAWPRATDELLAVALPGHGGGDVQPGWDANLEVVGRAVAAARADAVVGYSLGARVALGLVVTGRAPRAALISVNAGIADADRPARRAQDARWAELLRERGVAAFADAWQAQPLFATQARAAADVRAARRARRLALDPAQLARSLDAMGLAAMPDYRDAVRRMQPPPPLVVGADDSKFVAIARALALPDTHALAASGHDPTLEQPVALAQLLAKLLR
jgi:2-succinyl-6-hydroxy-2,4-cyclohexadiene-1-carboxylate synthase